MIVQQLNGNIFIALASFVGNDCSNRIPLIYKLVANVADR